MAIDKYISTHERDLHTKRMCNEISEACNSNYNK